MHPGSPSVTYILPDKIGGIFNYVDNLLANRKADDFVYHAILTDNLPTTDARSDQKLAANHQSKVCYRLPPENLHAVMKRLAQAIPAGEGVIVCNDLIELATLSVHDNGKTIVNITHADSDYYYELAVRHESIIHCFVTYTKYMHEQLLMRLPHRRENIFHLPYGVRIPETARRFEPSAKLQLLYVGRINKQKGVFDLPKIDARLRSLGVKAEWTVQGTGPHETQLKEAWKSPTTIRWMGKQAMDQVLKLYPEHDVVVMPSRSEGLPVALLEACAAGVVPVVSDLPTGIPEVVKNGVTGYRRPVGDIDSFANSIETLDRDRQLLQAMSRAARNLVAESFNIEVRAVEYQDFYARHKEFYRPRLVDPPLNYGSRLDRSWLPNKVVTLLRSSRRRSQRV